jgi:hypothetical protein
MSPSPSRQLPPRCRATHLPALLAQVLSPTKKGVGGTGCLNAALQPVFNPGPSGSGGGGGGGSSGSANGRQWPPRQAAGGGWDGGDGGGPSTWRVQDKVVQMVNSYEDDVYNGG